VWPAKKTQISVEVVCRSAEGADNNNRTLRGDKKSRRTVAHTVGVGQLIYFLRDKLTIIFPSAFDGIWRLGLSLGWHQRHFRHEAGFKYPPLLRDPFADLNLRLGYRVELERALHKVAIHAGGHQICIIFCSAPRFRYEVIDSEVAPTLERAPIEIAIDTAEIVSGENSCVSFNYFYRSHAAPLHLPCWRKTPAMSSEIPNEKEFSRKGTLRL